MIAVERPLGYSFGPPNDRGAHRELFVDTLKSLESMGHPGSELHITNKWSPPSGIQSIEPDSTPPIMEHLLKHPLSIRNLYIRQVPEKFKSHQM